MKHLNKILLPLFLITLSCSDSMEQPATGSSTSAGPWAIPENRVFDGGPGKDGIPALTNPDMVSVDATGLNYLNEDDLVLGIKIGEAIHAYPHPILDWHEIINTTVANKLIAVTYCPLTGTGSGWDRRINGAVTEFGVSGLLFNSNLIPYDRFSDSNWSQILRESVQGEFSGMEVETHTLVETSWKTWKSMYPSTLVASSNTGYSRTYGFYPYNNYKTSSSLIFPVENSDSRLHAKERVLGTNCNGEVKAYRFVDFDNGAVLEDTLGGESILVIGNQSANYLMAFFKKDINENTLNSTFSYVSGNLPVVMKDDQGNEWDIFGNAVSGPDAHSKLETVPGFIGYWFAWAAFYPEISIYNQ